MATQKYEEMEIWRPSWIKKFELTGIFRFHCKFFPKFLVTKTIYRRIKLKRHIFGVTYSGNL